MVGCGLSGSERTGPKTTLIVPVRNRLRLARQSIDRRQSIIEPDRVASESNKSSALPPGERCERGRGWQRGAGETNYLRGNSVQFGYRPSRAPFTSRRRPCRRNAPTVGRKKFLSRLVLIGFRRNETEKHNGIPVGNSSIARPADETFLQRPAETGIF